MAIDNHLSEGRRPLTYQLQVKGGAAVETLAADLQLTAKSSQILKLDPGGSARNVTLPGEDQGVADTDGLAFEIVNAADGLEDLVVKDPAGSTVVTISQNEKARVVGTGAQAYAHLGIVSIALA